MEFIGASHETEDRYHQGLGEQNLVCPTTREYWDHRGCIGIRVSEIMDTFFSLGMVGLFWGLHMFV